MALTAEQRAMLQLILERGQSYADIAGVLGVGVEEVRSRARGALRDLSGTDPDAQVGLTDYLLGQADPIGRADAVRHLQSDPDSRQLASELIASLRELAPGAQLPQLPKPRERRGVLRRRGEPAAPPRPRAEGAEPKGPSAGARMRDTFSRRQQQLLVALAASAVLVIAAVLGIAGAFGGGEESEPATNTQATTADQGEVLETVTLEPQGGRGSGEASFGVASGDQPYVDLTLSGLEAPQENETFVVWLLLSGNQGYPLSPLQVSADGTFSDRFPIPRFAIPIASRARFVDISLSQNRSLLGDLRKAVNKERPILGYQGDSVLRGEIPAAARTGGGGGGQGGG
jgi:hypothetical protein